MAANKQLLRERLKAERRRLTAAEVRKLSTAIAERVLKRIDWERIGNLHIYWPLVSQREVDSKILLQEIWKRYPKIRTATWPARGESGMAWIDPSGSRQPVRPEQQFDAVVVPMLGFNADCHRIGFGGGSYDRFLAGQPDALKLGIAYDFALCEFESEPYDVALDFICTEERIVSRP